ncbi:MAG: DUF4270 family protein [Sphingobacteriia bacterium]|nr:MAG: DUF4270 family protein [Sphingobacteriia bacterium]
MVLNFKLRRAHLSLFVLLLIVASCTRITTTELGSGLIPAVDGVNTLDTIMEVITDNFDDPDTTRIYRSNKVIIGAITNDPIFGRTSASVNFELYPNSFPFFIPGTKDSITVDSAVLILSYRGIYGDSAKPLRLRVDEISTNTPLNPFRAYPVNHPNVNPVNTIGSLANPFDLDIRTIKDSVKNRYEKATNQIRIKLRQDVARRFIKDYDSTNAYRSDSTFRSFFAGFSLKVDAVNPANALLYLNLQDTNTKLALYYNSSTTGATVRDTNVIYFRFSPIISGMANFVTRNRSGAEINSRLTTTSKPDSLVYVQAEPGTYVRIRIPNLGQLSNRIIHRAELIAEQVPDDNNLLTLDRYFEAPRSLLLSIYDSVNKRKRSIPNDFIIDQSGPNLLTFGGFASLKSVPGYDRIINYNFNLSRYVQGIVTRKDSSFVLRLSAPSNDSLSYFPPYPNGFISQMYYLSPTQGNETSAGRVRLGGGSHSRFRMRLRIVYSRLY